MKKTDLKTNLCNAVVAFIYIVLPIILILVTIAVICLRVYAFIKYADTPPLEVPFWVHVIMQQGGKG